MTEQSAPNNTPSNSLEDHRESAMTAESVAPELPDNHRSGFVAVVGRPNVGKSTFLNQLMRQKIAIVSPKPQTTRVRQLGIITEPDHQIVFIDTPGIMKKAKHKLDELMRESAIDTFQDADVVVWLVDGTEEPRSDEQEIAQLLSKTAAKVLLVINKNDQVLPHQVLAKTTTYRQLLPPDADWFFISAELNRGVDDVYQAILGALPLGPRYYPEEQITDLFVRDIAAEMIREQLLRQLRDEVPHGAAVVIMEFNEDETPLHIQATIFVERDSHKQIVIGHRGDMLKRVGAAARQDIEALIEQQIFLELWVKVAPKWRREEKALKRFGYME